jgi:hypothetical protein
MVRGQIGVLVLMATVSSVWADQTKGKPHSADIAALRLQIKLLQTEEKATVKSVKAQYDSILEQDKLSHTQLEEVKTALRAQEKILLALATDSDEKKTIRDEYQLLFKVLTGEVQLDKGVIKEIKTQEKAHVALIRTLYKAKIKELQLLIAALEKKGHGKGHK